MTSSQIPTDKEIEELLSGANASVSYKSQVKGQGLAIHELEQLMAKDPTLKIGYHGTEKAYEDGTTMVEVAIYNEFGTKNIPERSWIRSTMDEKGKEHEEFFTKLIDKVMTGKMTPLDALNAMGLKIQSDMQRKLESIFEPPNAPSTIEKKGSSKPLIDQGHLRRSLRYVINYGRKE